MVRPFLYAQELAASLSELHAHQTNYSEAKQFVKQRRRMTITRHRAYCLFPLGQRALTRGADAERTSVMVTP